ncbi:MAG: PilZ domain-containing protein [Acidobacteria bacterium]|nr:PilZ domain-containing protein [Acidobacteriota bacterium]
MDERRRAERLPVRIPIELRGGTGITRDLSGLGVFFTAAFPFEGGEQIEFVLRVPDSINVRCTGRVVRSDFDREGMSYGVAVTIDEYTAAEGDLGESRDAEILLRELRRHHG